MIPAALGVILSEDESSLVLGEKKKGEIGTGVLSGSGGKVEPGESPEECLIRETWEELEVHLDPASLILVAYIVFHKGRTRFILLNKILQLFGLGTVADFGVYVYQAKILSGELHETADMIPAWYPRDNPPYDRMYESDRHWFPKALRGEKFNANVFYRSRARDFDHIDFLPFALPR